MSRSRLIVDTDILSEVMKSIDSTVIAQATHYSREFNTLTFTSVSVLEILHGLRRKSAFAKMERAESVFSRNDEIVPDAQDYRLAAEIGGALSQQGTPIGLFDPLIASCAIRRGYGVATGNTAHFEFIRTAGYEFHIENWRVI